MLPNAAHQDERTRLALVPVSLGVDPIPVGLKLDASRAGELWDCIQDLDIWLDNMRMPGGYGGPAVAWNGDCLDFNEPGLDWRYEGIISGYINLWYATSNPDWLVKAQLAGNDLIFGQFQTGNFRNSCFEDNPNSGGSPHEAAVCLVLLKLALALRSLNDANWSVYAQTAMKNLSEYQIKLLWDPRQKTFLDGSSTRYSSPDRLATLAEAIFASARITGDSQWVEQYAFSSLDAILSHQVTQGFFKGAIYWRSVGKTYEGRFFPFLIARCIPGLLQGYLWTGESIYADAILRSIYFLTNNQEEDGRFPQVIYSNRRIQKWPARKAGVGDILRALSLGWFLYADVDLNSSLDWLLKGRMDNGAISSGVGFGLVSIPGRKDDPRDQLPSCGWVDKAFRFLTTILDVVQLKPEPPKFME